MNGKKCIIITGGECRCDRVDPGIADGAYVIAADSGVDTALKLGIKVQTIVGDMDSVKEKSFLGDDFGGIEREGARLVANLGEDNVEVLLSPPEKDDTDTMLAVSVAESMGFCELVIIGGGGGRADHWLSNIFMLEALMRRGISAELRDGTNRIRVAGDGEYTVDSHGYFGLLALEDSTVSVSGCKYPLKDSPLVRLRPYAVSNEVDGDRAVITVRGTVIITESEK